MVKTRAAARAASKKFKYQKLPWLSETTVNHHMDFTTKNAIAKCSKKSQSVVNSAPSHHFHYIKFGILDDRKSQTIKVLTKDKSGTTEWIFEEFFEVYRSKNCIFDTIEFPPDGPEAKIILRYLNEKSQFWYIEEENEYKPYCDSDEWEDEESKGGEDEESKEEEDGESGKETNENKKEEEQKMEKFRPLQCKEIILNVYHKMYDYLGIFLRLVDSNSVKKLAIKGHLTYLQYLVIANEEHWDNAKTLYIESCFKNDGYCKRMIPRRIHIGDLSHFVNLDIGPSGISARDAVDLINYFRYQDHPIGSKFLVECRDGIPCDEIVKSFGSGADNRPIPNIDAHHMQVWKLKSYRLAFVVVVHKDYVKGQICDSHSIEEEFKRVVLDN